MPYVTNIQENPHNAWTLIKHGAKSVNKGAGKVDELIYGRTTNVTVTAVQPPKAPKERSAVKDVCFGLLGFVFFVVIFVAYIRGDITKRDIFTP